MADEPTLSELANIPSEASLSTSGQSSAVLNLKDLNDHLFDYAKQKASYDWQKYQQFLANYKDLAKQGSEIANMDVSQEDRGILQKKMGDIFSQIEKDPKSSLGGKGMFTLQSQLSQLASDATQSKQDNAWDTYHRKFVELNPSFNTDENKAKVQTFTKSPLGQRNLYMLEQPSIWDASAFAKQIKGLSENNYAQTHIDKDEDLKPKKGFITDESGIELNPKSFQAQWNMALQDPKSRVDIQKTYGKLPDDFKAKNPIEKWFSDLGAQYMQSIVPAGTATTAAGNVRYSKNFKTTHYNQDPVGVEWYNARTARMGEENKKPPLVQGGNVIDHVSTPQGKTVKGDDGKEYVIRNGQVFDAVTGQPSSAETEIRVPKDYFSNSIYTLYNNFTGKGAAIKLDQSGKQVTDPNAAIPSRIAETSILSGGSKYTIRIKGGMVDGVKTTNGYADRALFQNITSEANNDAGNKIYAPADIGGNGSGVSLPVFR